MNFFYLMVEINILMSAVDENIFEGHFRDIRGSRFRSFPDSVRRGISVLERRIRIHTLCLG